MRFLIGFTTPGAGGVRCRAGVDLIDRWSMEGQRENYCDGPKTHLNNL